MPVWTFAITLIRRPGFLTCTSTTYRKRKSRTYSDGRGKIVPAETGLASLLGRLEGAASFVWYTYVIPEPSRYS